MEAPKPTINTLLPYHRHNFVAADRCLELYFTGCSRRCEGCHNQELWNRTGENTIWKSPESIMAELEDYPKIAKSVHILGGEPYECPENALASLLKQLKDKGFKEIILFTGNSYAPELLNAEFVKYIDVLKLGHYDKAHINERNIDNSILGFPLASLNQYAIKIGK